MAVYVLIQGEALNQTHPAASALARGAAPGPATPHTLTVAGEWTQRYDGAGIQLPDPGISQGALGEDGHERSLVGFTIDLPSDADVTLVRLHVPWTHWTYPNGVGDLLLGWHTHDTPPLDWTVGDGAAQLSTYETPNNPLNLPLGWGLPDGFAGLTVGPGWNDSPLYAGSTDVDPGQWQLVISYSSRQGEPHGGT